MFDTEKFIQEIEKRQGLYNVKCKEYCNKDQKAKLWDEVADEMYENLDELSSNDKSTLGKTIFIFFILLYAYKADYVFFGVA